MNAGPQPAQPAQPPAAPESGAAAAGPRTGARAAAGTPVDSALLFGGASELLIDHRGVLYRLKQTSLGKLILTK